MSAKRKQWRHFRRGERVLDWLRGHFGRERSHPRRQLHDRSASRCVTGVERRCCGKRTSRQPPRRSLRARGDGLGRSEAEQLDRLVTDECHAPARRARVGPPRACWRGGGWIRTRENGAPKLTKMGTVITGKSGCRSVAGASATVMNHRIAERQSYLKTVVVLRAVHAS